MRRSIPLSEVAFEPSSVIDTAGRLFHWHGAVYRAISPESAAFYRHVLENKNIQSLFSQGLVPTEITSFSLDGYSLVLRHERLPFTSYCMEWSSEMLRDAALLICDLSLQLYQRGLVLKDAHPWNILFDAGRPVFVDFGSICSLQDCRQWPYVEFRDSFIFPLYLMSVGLSRLARLLMLDVKNPLSRGDVFRLLIKRPSARSWLAYWLADMKHSTARYNVHPAFFRSLRRAIESIPLSCATTEWSHYQGLDARFSHEYPHDWPAKVRNVHELLEKARPTTVLDIGCHRGWLSELAALRGADVVAMDVDDPSITALYRRAGAKKLSILPLLIDVCAPTPAHGLMHAFPAAQTRLQSDMVLALALTHHLAFKRGMSFELLAERLAGFTKQWLLVEFVPPDDQHVREWVNERFRWYHLEGFRTALKGFFNRIEVLDSSPAPRVLLLCRR